MKKMILAANTAALSIPVIAAPVAARVPDYTNVFFK